VLISGVEGTGKSTLFKVLANVWPFGKGEIGLPSGPVLFMPQKPVLPTRCTLREALSYPQPPGTYSDEDMLHALREVGLEGLLVDSDSQTHDLPSDEVLSVAMDSEPAEGERAFKEYVELKVASPSDMSMDYTKPLLQEVVHDGEDYNDTTYDTATSEEEEVEEEHDDKDEGLGLSRSCNWVRRLSPGMQQRLVLGHAILQKPVALFLDEATCHVAKSSAVDLYASLCRNLPGEALIVSISHDVDTMESIHDSHYIIQGKGPHKRLHLAKHHDVTFHDPQPGDVEVDALLKDSENVPQNFGPVQVPALADAVPATDQVCDIWKASEGADKQKGIALSGA